MLVELVPEKFDQFQLLDVPDLKGEKLMQVIDEINAKGKCKVFYVSQGIGAKQWEMKPVNNSV